MKIGNYVAHFADGRAIEIPIVVGRDNLAVTWQMPGEPPPENLSPAIPGTYLAVLAEWLKAPASTLASGKDKPQ